MMLTKIPPETNVTIDGKNARYIDPDVVEIINNFKHNAYSRGIIVQLENIQKSYTVPKIDTKVIEEINN